MHICISDHWTLDAVLVLLVSAGTPIRVCMLSFQHESWPSILLIVQRACFDSSYLKKYPYREKRVAGLTFQQELRWSGERATGSNNAGKVSGTKAKLPAVQAARSLWSASVRVPAPKRPCTP